MRLNVTGAAAVIGLGVLLSGCATEIARVDQQEAAERGVEGAALGAVLGAGLGAIAALDPGLGGLVGAAGGAAIGAAIGVATAQPLPGYAPIALPATAVIPGFYDTWPPGYHPPPLGSGTPPPPPG